MTEDEGYLTPDYEGYELERGERSSLEEIRKHCARGYNDEKQIRDHLNYLEHLNQKIAEILRNEQQIGYANDTLQHDYAKIKQLMGRLNTELDAIDQDLGAMDTR